MTSYSDLLKHPKWQKKRLAILERADFACEKCGDKEKTLHVHHGYYEKGKKPWEYSNYSLHCLCEGCHDETTSIMSEIKQNLGIHEMDGFERILGFIQGDSMYAPISNQMFDSTAPAFFGVCDAFHVEIDRVHDFLEATKSPKNGAKSISSSSGSRHEKQPS